MQRELRERRSGRIWEPAEAEDEAEESFAALLGQAVPTLPEALEAPWYKLNKILRDDPFDDALLGGDRAAARLVCEGRPL